MKTAETKTSEDQELDFIQKAFFAAISKIEKKGYSLAEAYSEFLYFAASEIAHVEGVDYLESRFKNDLVFYKSWAAEQAAKSKSEGKRQAVLKKAQACSKLSDDAIKVAQAIRQHGMTVNRYDDAIEKIEKGDYDVSQAVGLILAISGTSICKSSGPAALRLAVENVIDDVAAGVDPREMPEYPKAVSNS